MIQCKFKGRLGNQLFQIASTIGIAKKLNTSYEFDEWEYSKYFTNQFPVKKQDLPGIEEPHFHYSDGWIKDNKKINGWLQSEKYFDPEFKFEFQPVFKSLVMAKFSEALSKETIAISIRRGDYIGNSNYHQLSIGWHVSALNSLDYKDKNIIIFSDDLNFCRIHFEGCYFADGSDIEQLCLMSMCDTCIIANSTFSWWGAYLSGGHVIHSGKLFSGNLLKNDISDFYPERWTEYTNEKIDLSDVTFLIPVKRDSGERAENLRLNIQYLKMYFKTNILVGEQGTKAFQSLGVTYEYFEDIKVFHRTRMLNEMCGMVKTPIIVNFDADVFLPVFTVLRAVEAIRNGSDVVYPYTNFVELDRSEVRNILQLSIKGSYKEPESYGGAIFFNRESFISGGMENENFISYGPEDLERFYRFTKLGFKVERFTGKIYHLNHPRTKDSSNKNPYFNKNWTEYDKIREMNEEQLKEYVNNFEWLIYERINSSALQG